MVSIKRARSLGSGWEVIESGAAGGASPTTPVGHFPGQRSRVAADLIQRPGISAVSIAHTESRHGTDE